ncbi:N-acetyl-alpha-D-glucosaminyl L-malate synthase [subsurface metagenome]
MMLIPNGFIGIIAKKIFGIPTVAWVRGGDWYLSRDNVFKKIMIEMVLRHSNLILTQADTIKKDILCEYPNTKIKVVPNAVDTEHEKANGEGIIFVGNLVERKGVKNLVLAIQELRKRGYKELRTTIVGAGPEKENLMKMAYGTGIAFIGGVPPEKVGEYIKKHSIFVLPSVKGEGLPNVILEAMSFGLPVIATRIAGTPDVVKHGETGFLVEPDNPIELADGILKVYANNRLRENMRMKTLQEIKKYSWDSVISQLEDIYRNVLMDSYDLEGRRDEIRN